MGKNSIRKANTNKIISKIVHNAKKETPRQHRKRLKESRYNPSVSTAHPNKLKIGSINVDGLDLQTDAALRDLLSARDFDVSIIKDKILQLKEKLSKLLKQMKIKFSLINNMDVLWVA